MRAHHVIQTILPERLARQHIKLLAGCTLGEDGAVDSNLRQSLDEVTLHIDSTYVALQDAGIGLNHLGRRSVEDNRPSSVARPVQVLPSGVAVIN